MAMRTLGEALESALASILNDCGEGGVGAPPDAVKLPKGARTIEGPGQVTELRQREEKPDGASHERTNVALPIGRKQRIAPGSPIPVVAGPMPAVRCFLVIEGGLGGRPAGSGGVSRAAYRASGEEGEPARNWLKLVV